MPNANIFPFWGQSNNRGRGTLNASLPPAFDFQNGHVMIWDTFQDKLELYHCKSNSDTRGSDNDYPQCWGPEAQFATRYLADNPTSNVYLFKFCVGGTSMDYWNPTNHLYFDDFEDSLNRYKDFLSTNYGLTPVVPAIFGMQGESDTATLLLSQTFQAARQALFYQARNYQRWGSLTTRLIDGRVNINTTGATYITEIRAAQTALASEFNLSLINTDDIPLNPDNLHFTPDGYNTLGDRFYEALIA